jgi:signal transduction histidine kinase/uncharacterized protein YneF (UPF0154 family)
LKYWNSLSIYTRWLLVSGLITFFCVFSGLYITRRLTDREMERNRPLHGSYQAELIKKLVSRSSLSVDEAYEIVMLTPHRFVPPNLLVDETGQTVRSLVPPHLRDFKEGYRIQLSPQRAVVFSNEFKGPKGPPPEAIIIGTISMAVSVIVGLGLSIIFINFYVRKKSIQAENVINLLKGGDLKARFEITATDEAGELMVKFNEMADQIQSLVENLRHTESARKKLLQELAHDLRTPVASMKNLQEILLEKGHLMDEEKRHQVQTLAVKEVNYFERLVEDLLFLSGVNDPRYSTDFRSFDLATIVEDELDLWSRPGLEIQFDADPEIMITGDQHLITRLIKNALSNSSRYAFKDIHVGLRNLPEGIRLIIVDDGPGLKTEEVTQFGQKKFSRKFLDSDHSHISIGLGSVIMKKIMDLHEGEMLVKNLSPGLEITFLFPHPSSFHHSLG